MKRPVIGILRGFSTEQLAKIVETALRGGLEYLEVTMNSAGAREQIREARAIVGERMKIGAGTVLSLRQLDQALAAGANFIVTPTVQREVIERCAAQGVPVYPGAFSPTEVVAAWDLGATMVKIFPAETLGAKYIRALKAPLPQIKLLPTGGVDLETITEFSKAGADGFGVGSPLFNRERIESGDWDWLERQCVSFVAAANRT
jgi:2-dehydro-3-deoxyphosphogluconate aldolase / (4S)-4-hydroxy-2-oxoglutarate aldolase